MSNQTCIAPEAATDTTKLAAIPAEHQPRLEPGQEQKTFLDEKELLKRLPVSRRTLFNWRESGKIPSVKIGRRCLYHFPSVEQALLRLQRGGGQ
jgi:predicted DNA-binding transcriptional regulator AlpA